MLATLPVVVLIACSQDAERGTREGTDPAELLPPLAQERFGGWSDDDLMGDDLAVRVVEMPESWRIDETRSFGSVQRWTGPIVDGRAAEVQLTSTFHDGLDGDPDWYEAYDLSSNPGETASEWDEGELRGMPMVVRERSGPPRVRAELNLLLGNWLIHVSGTGAAADDDVVAAFAERDISS